MSITPANGGPGESHPIRARADTVLVTCPRCGHAQPEPSIVFSTVCKRCGNHIRVGEPAPPVAPRAPESRTAERRRITCFDCGAELDVPVSAQSTMCKRCSRYIDLKDYRITNAVSRNFKTKGAFVLEASGYVFNTEAIVGDAVIKGRFLGKLVAERSLAIHSTAEIKGTIATSHLIIPAANHFRWKELIAVGSAEVAGELAANLRVAGSVIVKSTARFFGDLDAGSLGVEAGAVIVGNIRVIGRQSRVLSLES